MPAPTSAPAVVPPLPGAVARRAGLAVLVAVAVAGVYLLGLGLVDQGRRLAAFHAAGLGYRDAACGLPFCDSAVFWLAGRLARAGAVATLYNAPAFQAYGAAALAGALGNFPFFYPPVTLLPAVLLSWLSLPAAYFGFTACGVAAFLILLRRAGLPWFAILLGLASPAAMWSIYLGQFGLLCGALLLAGLARLAARPVEAGILLGLLALKPPYAFAAPFAVLAGRHWRALLAGLLTILFLAVLATVCFGAPAWAGFLGPGRAAATGFLVSRFQHGNPVLGVSLFWMLRSLGAPLLAACLFQAAMVLLAARLLVQLWRRPPRDAPARLLASVALVLLASPYAYADDMVAISTALPLLWRPGAPRANALLAVVWFSPAATGFFLRTLHFLPEPLFIAAALILAMIRATDWTPPAPAPA